MTDILLAFLLLSQGVPALPVTTGMVTGVLRSADGKPARGIRVVAQSQADLTGAAGSTAILSLAETDDQGRYRLENIPPGSYFIAAGSLGLMTYYPGKADMKEAKVVQIIAGNEVTGINFASLDETVIAENNARISVVEAAIPIRVVADDGAGIPIYADGKYIHIQVTQKSTGTPMLLPMTTSMLNVPLDNGGGGEFRIQVVNLPDGYTLKSITYGSSELSDGVVAISRSNLWIPSSRSSALTSLSNFGPVFVRAESRESVSIHLARVDSRLPAKAGARVSGKSRYFGYRAVYISGVPGTAFTDGSFEFRGVPPGRHTIVSVDDSGPTYPLGASVVVGSGDIHDVTLEVSSALPFDIGVPMPPSPVEGHSSGVAIPLATLDVAIVDEAIREWIPGGTLVISSRTRAGYSLRGPEGRFEIHGLFPGAYDLEFLLSGYSPVRQSVVVGDDDIHLEFALHPIVP